MPLPNIAKPLALTMLTAGAVPSQAAELFQQTLPRQGASPAAFAPPGWRLEQQAEGDLNKDGVTDLAAILIQENSGDGQEEAFDLQRGLIVLLGRDRQAFQLGGGNDKLLVCKGCGGVKESVSVAIEKGVMVVEQTTGSREYSDQTWRFRHDAATGRFLLIGMDQVDVDGLLGSGSKASRNYLTGLSISESFRPDASGERSIVTSSKKAKGQPKTLFLEEADTAF